MVEPLNKIALSLGPISVHWYGIILGCAALIGMYLTIREGKRFRIHPEVLWIYAVWRSFSHYWC